ncbi:hypothetical protein Pcinc_042769, partial [Petrolisthes cinctipes]
YPTRLGTISPPDQTRPDPPLASSSPHLKPHSHPKMTSESRARVLETLGGTGEHGISGTRAFIVFGRSHTPTGVAHVLYNHRVDEEVTGQL